MRSVSFKLSYNKQSQIQQQAHLQFLIFRINSSLRDGCFQLFAWLPAVTLNQWKNRSAGNTQRLTDIGEDNI